MCSLLSTFFDLYVVFFVCVDIVFLYFSLRALHRLFYNIITFSRYVYHASFVIILFILFEYWSDHSDSFYKKISIWNLLGVRWFPFCYKVLWQVSNNRAFKMHKFFVLFLLLNNTTFMHFYSELITRYYANSLRHSYSIGSNFLSI